VTLSYLPYHFQACENLAYAFAHTVELSSDKSKFVVSATSQDDISRILQFTFEGEKKEHVSTPPSYRAKLTCEIETKRFSGRLVSLASTT